ncbi:mechanosensitive ion channel [candidate division NPL-UPA2 bacterium]|nr:mechanosensitive ion channel [candidate division NPL-UPA2 bacterium]
MAMEQITTRTIWGLVSLAILGGVSLAAKETISNIWAALSFMLNPGLRRGSIIEVKVQGELLKGTLKGFGLSRAVIENREGNTHLILVSDIKKATIKVIGNKPG